MAISEKTQKTAELTKEEMLRSGLDFRPAPLAYTMGPYWHHIYYLVRKNAQGKIIAKYPYYVKGKTFQEVMCIIRG